jgi:acyl-CoA synthetase (AMP-forming)/AMP-acid ligase II
MNCCHRQIERKPQRSWLRSASGCLGSGTLLVLLPKCPMCIAAYVALWTGASVAIPVATRLRSLLEILFVVSAVLLLARGLVQRAR